MLLALGRPFSWENLMSSNLLRFVLVLFQHHAGNTGDIDRHIDSRDGGDVRLRLLLLWSSVYKEYAVTSDTGGIRNCFYFFRLQLPLNQFSQNFSPPPPWLCSWSHNLDVCLGQVLGFSDLLCLLSINT